ncbi:TPA: glycosyltransferase family 4 protein [Candidatus Poribacteria bacterium]|nr:glycosyltransferase family 4 protein [Candidatus Poribacteria bacterium]
MKLLAIVGESSTVENFLRQSNLDGWNAISRKVEEIHLVIFTYISKNSIFYLSEKIVLHAIWIPPLFSKNPLLRLTYATMYAIRLFKKIKKFDIIIFLTGSIYIFSCFLFRLLLFKHLVVIVLGNDFEIRLKLGDVSIWRKLSSRVLNLLELACIMLSDRVLCVGISLSKALLARGIPSSKIRIVFNGVNTRKFLPRKKNSCGKKFRLLYAGRLSPEKRVNVIIQAFKLLKKYGVKGIELKIVGDGPLKTCLTRYARNLEDITFIERQQHDKMPSIINDSDILILTSISEGLPSIVLEAMACGKPVICTPVGDIPYIIKDGVNSFLLNNVSERNSFELAERLKMLILDKEYCKKVGLRARKAVEKLFDWDRIGERYYHCFREILGET